jgi:hypothetical protein
MTGYNSNDSTRVYRLSPEGVVDWYERSSSGFHQAEDGEDFVGDVRAVAVKACSQACIDVTQRRLSRLPPQSQDSRKPESVLSTDIAKSVHDLRSEQDLIVV